MKNCDARPKGGDQGTAHLDSRPILDAVALRNLGLTDAEIVKALQGSTCVSEQELHDRWRLVASRAACAPQPLWFTISPVRMFFFTWGGLMKTIDCWNDLLPFGIDALTGEACSLSYRILFDVTEAGRKVLARCFGVANLQLAEPWNRGTTEDLHVGSILLTQDMLTPVSVFALLEAGCAEVWVYRGGGVLGVEPGDDPARTEARRKHHGDSIARVFRQGPDRNRHAMTGRVE